MSSQFRDIEASYLLPPDPGSREAIEARLDLDEVLAEVEAELLRHIDPDEHPLMPYLRWRLGVPTHVPTRPRPGHHHTICLVCHQPIPHDLSQLAFPVPACVVGELQAMIQSLRGELLRLKAAQPMIGLIEAAIDRVVERVLARGD